MLSTPDSGLVDSQFHVGKLRSQFPVLQDRKNLPFFHRLPAGHEDLFHEAVTRRSNHRQRRILNERRGTYRGRPRRTGQCRDDHRDARQHRSETKPIGSSGRPGTQRSTTKT